MSARNISFSQLGKNGRLGNQLFQIHSTLGIAERLGATAAFPAWEYEKYFEPSLPHGEMQTNTVHEKYFHVHEWDIQGDADLLGYMQSERYFGAERLRFKAEFLQGLKESHADLFGRETICIHIRRGDYVGNKSYYQLPITYYIDSLLSFPNWRECNILFLSDDIEYCKVHFECLPNAYFSVGKTDVEDLALASLCDHFILCNSSFSWWAAWLGEKPHSRIVHSGHLYAGRLAGNDIKDYYPPRWMVNKKDEYKIPLNDVTFTIPVRYDHEDRRENFDLSLFMLQSAFDTRYIVCEQGGDEFAYAAKWGKYMRLPSDDFHRTKMLNDMAIAAETPYIVNWDCDIILPPMQVYLAVEALRAGADMVFPYGGKFARMKRVEWFGKIRAYQDIGIVGNEPFKGREQGHNSVGGAVLFNKDSFIDGGMENQNMISFGPEDCERHDRFKLLGYDIRRVGGVLFHLNHYVGENSSPLNPYFAANEREIEKVRGMDAKQLRAYVDTWTWRHPYTSRYYHAISDGAIRSAEIVMRALADIGIQPTSIIDIGCGVGEWNNGHAGYFGVDYRVDPQDLLIPLERYSECNLNQVMPEIRGQFDLCLCLEVAEHLKPQRAKALVEYLCSTSDLVLFSAAIPYQGGNGHCNEKWQSYWSGLFQQRGFGAAKEQPHIRDNRDVEYWYRQNIVLYERGATGIAQDYVLPEYYMQIVEGLR